MEGYPIVSRKEYEVRCPCGLVETLLPQASGLSESPRHESLQKILRMHK